MKKVFYEKVGRRYIPVNEYDSELCSALPKGVHVIMSYPGGQSTRYKIDPAYAPMIAAGRVAEDAISRAIHKASELSPHNKIVTPEQREAWNNLSKAFGSDRYYVKKPNERKIAKKGVKDMKKKTNKLLTNPSVKLEYDHFMLVCELTKEHNNE